MLEPIPIPPRERWRAFLTEILPALLFAAGVITVAVLWRESGTAPTLLAEAETIQAEVKSLRSGTVAEMRVKPLQSVAAGDTIAFVQTADPDSAESSLALIRAEIDLLMATQEPARLALEQRRLALEWMRERVTLASLRGQLLQSDAELARLGPLRERDVVSAESYDTARLQRERITAQAAMQEDLVTTIRPHLCADDTPATAQPLAVTDAFVAGIRIQEQRLRVVESQFAPTPLVAPMAGVVMIIHRRPGEACLAGEPVVTIVAPEPAQLIGFLRQPLPVNPTVGSSVEIRTRGSSRAIARGTLQEVSQVLEAVPPTLLAVFNRVGTPERGLRVHISVPPALALRPGEIVDVVLPASR